MNSPSKPSEVNTHKLFGRNKDIENISKKMLSGSRLVVYGPRKYGKTSLSHAVLDHLRQDGMAGIYVDLFPVTSIEDIVLRIYRSVVLAFDKPGSDEDASGLISSFKHVRIGPKTGAYPLVSLGGVPAGVHMESIFGALDDYCARHAIKACLVLDEIQEITHLKETDKIEQCVYAGLQSAKHISWLLLGSRQTILKDMLEDQQHSLSLQMIPLPMIDKTEITKYLLHAFQNEEVSVSREEMEQIVEFCDSCPYYIQKLITMFRPKGKGIIDTAKEFLITSEALSYEDIFTHLTTHQKQLLKAIAAERPSSIFSQAFFVEHRLGSQGGVQNSLSKLKKLDIIGQRDGQWRITDPIFEKWLVLQ